MISDKVMARINVLMLEFDDKISKSVAAKVRKEKQRTEKHDDKVQYESAPDYVKSEEEIRESEKAKRDIIRTKKAIDAFNNQEQSNIAWSIQKFEQ